MAVDTNFAMLKLDDPLWLSPRPWESIPSESGSTHSVASTSHSPPSGSFYDTSAVSEASLVRLAMNALQGIESSLMSIDKLSAVFCCDPADRTFHRIPSLWNRSLSTLALGKILKSIGCLGFEVFLLRKFVDYFTNLNLRDKSRGNEQAKSFREEEENDPDTGGQDNHSYSLVNHAFAIAVGKVLEGYISSLDTLFSSVGLRRSSKVGDVSSCFDIRVGCLTRVEHEFTLLEVYLHTEGLRTQIEVLGYVCNVHNTALCFSQSPFMNLSNTTKFSSFPRGGNLLTYLYTQLKVADTGHSALLKFLFLRSSEPYFGFIRSWIFKAKISDPFNEFIVAIADDSLTSSVGDIGILVNFPSATIREHDGVDVPCFLRDFLTPLFRAGQQLQVLMKLLELCDDVGSWNRTYEDFLPYWNGVSSDRLSHASPLAFNKESIQALVFARNNYYKCMMEKLGNLLTNLEFRYQQAMPHSAVPSVHNRKRSLSPSFEANNTPVFQATKTGNQNQPVGTVGSDSFSLLGFPPVEEPLEPSEYSSVNSSEEDDDEDENGLSEKVNEFPDDMIGQEQKYLSALSFCSSTSIDNSLQTPSQRKMSCTINKDSCQTSKKTCSPGNVMHTHDVKANLNYTSDLELDQNMLWTSEVQDFNKQHEISWPIGGLLKSPLSVDRGKVGVMGLRLSESGLKASNMMVGVQADDTSYSRDLILSKNVLTEAAVSKDQHPSGNTFNLNLWKVKYNSEFLSANPMLTKNSIVHLTSMPGERLYPEYARSMPSFDLISGKNPVEVYLDRPAVSTKQLGDQLSVSACSPVSGTFFMTNIHDGEDCSDEKVSIDKTRLSDVYLPVNVKPNVSGGSSWEVLLGSSRSTDKVNAKEQIKSAILEIPLDFILEKCLLEEIQLQYKYVSKLTIKLLEEGFRLQEHLLALRRYHLMESADWADLFLMSLQRHKWYAAEAVKSISEVQGLLELSVQRSSCETDQGKDRLYVYMKEQSAMPFPASPTGIHSFDVLGLGYRVDWPVSIILTPVALKIYAEIFSFLIQVKLAVSSLTEVWCLFKELKHLNYQNRPSELSESEAGRFNILMRLRQEIYHFVTTLQQYVQAQLSHVSWCRFLHSLQHKVKDMMDLESAHMEYLNDLLRICFLSNEMQSIADIVQSLLQCALDFRSSLVGSTWEAGLKEGFPTKLSQINISQVLIIKETFDKNIKDLFLCYLKTPRNGEFSLARFWEYLNYNEHYSNVLGKEMSRHVLPI